MKYILSCFNRIKFVWTPKFFFGKKFKLVFTYGGMIDHSFQGSNIKQIRISKEIEL